MCLPGADKEDHVRSSLAIRGRKTMRKILLLTIVCVTVLNTPWASAKSLWPKRNEGSQFEDHRAFQVGDVLTVVVEEQSRVSSSAGMDLEKTSSTEGSVDTLKIGKTGGAADVITGDMPEVGMGSSRSFSGGGDYTMSGSM